MLGQYLLEVYLLVSDTFGMPTHSSRAKEDTENRRRQLRLWIDTHFGGKQADFVRKHSLNQGEISALLVAKSFGSVKARNLEAQTGMPSHYLEQRGSTVTIDSGSSRGEPSPHPEFAGALPFVKRVAVVGTARMADDGWHEEEREGGAGFVEVFTRDGQAYALRVRGDAMAPAIRDGWLVVIEPSSEVAPGEYVLVQLKDGRKMITELLYERPDSVAVMSIKAGARLTLMRSDVAAVHAVAAIVPPSRWKV